MKITTSLISTLICICLFIGANLKAQGCIEFNDVGQKYKMCLEIKDGITNNGLFCGNHMVANDGVLTSSQWEELNNNPAKWATLPGSNKTMTVIVRIEPVDFTVNPSIIFPKIKIEWNGNTQIETLSKVGVFSAEKYEKEVKLNLPESSIDHDLLSIPLKISYSFVDVFDNDNFITAQMATRVVVTGRTISDTLYTTTAPSTVQLILRDPPGDESYSFLGAEKKICHGYGLSYATDNSNSVWGAVKLGAKGSVGFLVESEYEAYAKLEASLEMGIKRTAENKYESCIEAKEKYKTADGVIDGDVFIGAQIEYEYGVVYDLEYIPDPYFVCQPKVRIVRSLGFKPIGTKREFILTEGQIEEEISQLEAQINMPSTTEADRQFKKDQIEVWQNTLKLNNEIKAAAFSLPPTPFNFVGNSGSQEKSFSTTTSVESSLEMNVYVEKSVAEEVGVEVNGSGVSGGAKIRMRSEFGSSSNSSNTSTNEVGYYLSDDDDGDNFSVNIYPDPVFGTTIYSLGPNSATSCPYEGGKRRDLANFNSASDFVNTLNVFGIPGEKGDLLLNVCNDSETNEARVYQIFSPQTQSADIKFAGETIVTGVPVGSIEPESCSEKLLSIAKVSNDQTWYENIQLALTNNCTDDQDIISDTIHLNVLFGDTGPGAPENDAPCNAKAFYLNGLNPGLHGESNLKAVALNYKGAGGIKNEVRLTPESWPDKIENSVWYSFNPTYDGETNISVISNFDIQLALFTAGDCADFTTFQLVAENSSGKVLENIPLQAGVSYYLLVDGLGGSSGNFNLGATYPTDIDNDGVHDDRDNCLEGDNSFDDDADGVANACDLCPDDRNPGLAFDGLDDYVDLGTDLGNFGTADFTIELWVNTSQTPSKPEVSNIPLISKRSICGNANFWSFKFSSEGLPILEMIENDQAGNANIIGGKTKINDGKWHHLAAIRSAGTLIMMVDGKLESEISGGSITNINNETTVQLGKSACSDQPWADYFQGTLDEVRIWNIARTYEEIRLNWLRELQGNEEGLEAYLPLNGGRGSGAGPDVAFDYSGNGHDGLIQGGASNKSNWVPGAAIVSADADNDGIGRQCDPNENLTTGLVRVGSVEEIGLKVFPNPASETINLSFQLRQNEPFVIQLSNMTGSTVRSISPDKITGTGPHTLNIPLQGIPSGLYYLSLRAQNKVFTQKVVVMD